MAKIGRIEIEPAENSGYTVTHHFKVGSGSKMGSAFTAPKTHVFGAGEGHAMLAHVANHLGVPVEEGPKLTAGAASAIRDKANAMVGGK